MFSGVTIKKQSFHHQISQLGAMMMVFTEAQMAVNLLLNVVNMPITAIVISSLSSAHKWPIHIAVCKILCWWIISSINDNIFSSQKYIQHISRHNQLLFFIIKIEIFSFCHSSGLETHMIQQIFLCSTFVKLFICMYVKLTMNKFKNITQFVLSSWQV